MKKVGNVLLDILIVTVVIFALAMSVMVISSKASGVPNVFGYSPVTVQSDSMVPTFNVGDLLIIKQTNPDELKVGDVITFKELKDGYEILNTHRISEIVLDGSLTAYVTKGDHEDEHDIAPVRQNEIVGRWTEKRVPALGKAMDFVKTQTGIMICFVIPLALLFIWQLYKFIMLLAENKKQKAVEQVTVNIEAEKQKAIDEYIAQQKKQADAETSKDSIRAVMPPAEEPPEETVNPKIGQTYQTSGLAESAPDDEIEETFITDESKEQGIALNTNKKEANAVEITEQTADETDAVADEAETAKDHSTDETADIAVEIEALEEQIAVETETLADETESIDEQTAAETETIADNAVEKQIEVEIETLADETESIDEQTAAETETITDKAVEKQIEVEIETLADEAESIEKQTADETEAIDDEAAEEQIAAETETLADETDANIKKSTDETDTPPACG